MKKALCILLIFAILGTNFARVFVILGFKWHQEYITANLCINIDEPELNCSGICYLNAELQELENTPSFPNQHNISKDKIQNHLFLNGIYPVVKADVFYFLQKINTHHLSLPAISFFGDIWRPPQLTYSFLS